ncbi:hypothetical protein ACFLT4_07965 [Chloroflexota bacterium]
MERQFSDDLGALEMLASSVGLDNPEALSEELLTLHRRGHWFEPSIAHHVYGLHNDEQKTIEAIRKR